MKKRAIDGLNIKGFWQRTDVLSRMNFALYERKKDEDDFIEIIPTDGRDVYVILYHSGLELMKAEAYICPEGASYKKELEVHINAMAGKVYGELEDD